MKAERNAAAKALLNTIVTELVPADAKAAPTLPTATDIENPPRRPSFQPGSGRRGRYARQDQGCIHAVEERVIRELILDGKRPDGRGPTDLRVI